MLKLFMAEKDPNVYIDEKAVAQVDARIQETKTMTKNLMSSWSNPMTGVEEGPKGKVTAPKVQAQEEQIVAGRSGQVIGHIVKVPIQAIKTFKQLLPLFGDVDVRLTPDQKKLFLEALEKTPTPKLMSDAKAIFALMEALSK